MGGFLKRLQKQSLVVIIELHWHSIEKQWEAEKVNNSGMHGSQRIFFFFPFVKFPPTSLVVKMHNLGTVFDGLSQRVPVLNALSKSRWGFQLGKPRTLSHGNVTSGWISARILTLQTLLNLRNFPGITHSFPNNIVSFLCTGAIWINHKMEILSHQTVSTPPFLTSRLKKKKKKKKKSRINQLWMYQGSYKK